MNDTTLQMLALIVLASYLCAPGIRRLLGLEIQRARQSTRRSSSGDTARKGSENETAAGDAAASSLTPAAASKDLEETAASAETKSSPTEP